MWKYAFLIGLSTLVSSCGKKSPVEPLEPSGYPHTYPKPKIIEQEIVKKLKNEDVNDD